METRTEIQENNRLILDFMQVSLFRDSKEAMKVYPDKYPNLKTDKYYDDLYIFNEGTPTWYSKRFKDISYRSSWDWLMPVVDKINSLDSLELWDKNNVDKYNLIEAVSSVNIEDTFEIVVKFIKWYNQNKK